MLCEVKCSGNQFDHQPFPQSGQLAPNMNLALNTLRKQVAGQDQHVVYCYITTSMKYRDGQFVQKGCGPNFQGGLMTLCTCKHRMRTSMNARDWKGKWVAGFTSVMEYQRKNFLIYLMQVSDAFKSHYDLWFSKSIPLATKRAKAARLDVFGDIYQPQNRSASPFKPKDYVKPVSNHVHAKCSKGWHKDIDYKAGHSDRPAALLVGDPERSFLWVHPKSRLSSDRANLPRNCKKYVLRELLNQLEEV